jgi:GNAT superfamily N-acetyltransferase
MSASPQLHVRPSAAPVDLTFGDIAVTRVDSAADKKAFIEFQYGIYKGNPHFVPPLRFDRQMFLNPKKNPWFEFGTADLYLARRGGQVVGRIAAVLDPRYNDFHSARTGWFGLFECIDDQAVANALFETVEKWNTAHGMTDVMGPASFSSNGEWGFLQQGFDLPPSLMMPYNPEYYVRLTEGAGYSKSKDLWAWKLELQKDPPEKITRIAEKVKQREGIVVRPANLKDWDAEVTRVKDIYNAAWEKNWGFVPMTDREFDALGKELKLALVPELFLFAEIANKPVGFCITMPNMNHAIKEANGNLFPFGLVKLLMARRKIKEGRLIAMGIRKENRKQGIDSILMLETVRVAQRLGWWGGEVSWTLEDNDMVNRAIEVFGATKYKNYRVMGKALGAKA